MISDEATLPTKPRYYIGLMSGTSADGIDLSLVTFNQASQPLLHTSYYQAYSNDMANKITSLYTPNNDEIDRAFALDVELAKLFSKAIKALLAQEQLKTEDIIAIGSHGQTIRHRPQGEHPFTLQIGCCQTLATLTNIRVIGQFRRKDMALGGQGAPLVPAFHEKIFSEKAQDNASDVFVVNIGGISNLTFLPATNNAPVIGYDTGPGNALMDDWFQRHNPENENNYDKNGDWAASGKINAVLLTQLMTDEYFQLLPPKSTGREYFNLLWLEQQLAQVEPVANQDVQATLTALTALTLVDAILDHTILVDKILAHKKTPHCDDERKPVKIYLCGGGTHNTELKRQLGDQLGKQLANRLGKKASSAVKSYELLLTDQKSIDGDQLESIAFAWLAFAYDKKLLSSMPAVTGASKSCTLGVAFFP